LTQAVCRPLIAAGSKSISKSFRRNERAPPNPSDLPRASAMMASIQFEFLPGLLLALPLGALLAFSIWRQQRRGLPGLRIVTLGGLRGLVLLLLVFLAARPFWVSREPP